MAQQRNDRLLVARRAKNMELLCKWDTFRRTNFVTDYVWRKFRARHRRALTFAKLIGSILYIRNVAHHILNA